MDFLNSSRRETFPRLMEVHLLPRLQLPPLVHLNKIIVRINHQVLTLTISTRERLITRIKVRTLTTSLTLMMEEIKIIMLRHSSQQPIVFRMSWKTFSQTSQQLIRTTKPRIAMLSMMSLQALVNLWHLPNQQQWQIQAETSLMF